VLPLTSALQAVTRGPVLSAFPLQVGDERSAVFQTGATLLWPALSVARVSTR
jgi:hypothetical protein